MATPGSNPQLPPSKSSRLPEEILFQNFNANSQGTWLRQRMKNFEFLVAKTNLEDRVEQIRSLFDRSLKDYPRDNEDILRKMFERKCVELVRNACAPEFLNLHSRELSTVETYEKALEFLAGIFGVESRDVNFLGIKKRKRSESDSL